MAVRHGNKRRGVGFNGPWARVEDAMVLPTDEIEPEVPAAITDGGRPLFDLGAWGKEFGAKTFEQQADHPNAYHQQASDLVPDTTTSQRRDWINTWAHPRGHLALRKFDAHAHIEEGAMCWARRRSTIAAWLALLSLGGAAQRRTSRL